MEASIFYVVRFEFSVSHPVDRLTFGPFATHEEARAWADNSVFHDLRYEIISVLPPRADHARPALTR